MDGLAEDLIGQMDRDLLLNHNWLKYKLKVMAFIKDISGRFDVKFKIWIDDGTCTSIFTRRHIRTLVVKAIYLNEWLETLYNGEEVDPEDGWFEDDNRPENYLISFESDGVPVFLIMTEETQLGWAFKGSCTSSQELSSQIVYYMGRARLASDFLKIYKDSEGGKCSVPKGGLDEECN
ncbi:Hypothetical predicted protein [Prunus dulcis]|uniref:Uncharacterized protein n=1 Tax=Prunus dulcis TaxID=3755 RepID=A0A5E4G8X3_PRUDU|nr:Hypothetical predicted protein [Prunus dulcis]